MFLIVIFLLFAVMLFFSLIKTVFRAAFGAGKLIFSLIFWPIILLLLVFGAFRFLLPILIIGGVIFLIVKLCKRSGNVGSAPSGGREDYIDVEHRLF